MDALHCQSVQIRKQPPHSSVLFLTPTCEESNRLGSQYYVDNPTFAHEKIAACFNSDVIMFLGSFSDVTITGMGHSELDSLLEIEASKQGRYICNDPNPENGMFYRSDQLPFLKAGIPSLFAKGYSHQVELGREKTLQVVDEYWKTTLHKTCDEYYPDMHNLQGLVDDTPRSSVWVTIWPTHLTSRNGARDRNFRKDKAHTHSTAYVLLLTW